MQSSLLSFPMLKGIAAIAVLGVSGQALAAPDVLYPSAASATVAGSVAAVTGNFNPGNGNGNAGNGSVTLNAPVPTGQTVAVGVTWTIQDNSGNGNANSNTQYGQNGRTVRFTVSQTDGVALTLPAIANCTVLNKSAVCSTLLTVTPSAEDEYSINIDAQDTNTGNGRILGRIATVNFSAVAPVVQKLDTRLVVDKQCVILRQPSVALTSTLTALTTPESPVEGATVAYSVDASAVGSAQTNQFGVASLTYDPSGLGVGDHVLYGEFAGDALYNGSNDSDLLGVSYAFGGFRPPLNADGTSIFGGRVIPVKIKLTDFNGVPVTDAQPRVWVVTYGVGGIGEEVEAATSVSAADTGNIMRYDASEQQYVYNFDAQDLPNGSYKVRVDLGDSSACNDYREVPFTVQRKGKR